MASVLPFDPTLYRVVDARHGPMVVLANDTGIGRRLAGTGAFCGAEGL